MECSFESLRGLGEPAEDMALDSGPESDDPSEVLRLVVAVPDPKETPLPDTVGRGWDAERGLDSCKISLDECTSVPIPSCSDSSCFLPQLAPQRLTTFLACSMFTPFSFALALSVSNKVPSEGRGGGTTRLGGGKNAVFRSGEEIGEASDNGTAREDA